MLKLLKKFLSVLLLTATLLPAGYAAPENSTGADKSSEANNKALPHYTVELAPEVTLELVLLKGGTFIMGSPESEIGRWKGQGEDQRKVVITRPFYIAVFETTQAQYEAVMKRNPSVRSRGPHLPVTDVSWQDAMDFCARLNLLTEKTRPANYKFTLPTEAQWEYACRAGTRTALNNRKNLTHNGRCANLDEVGWYMGNSNGRVQIVGQKKPNAWGLYDMHGNAWEFCLDYWCKNPAQYSCINPQGPPPNESNGDHVKKGGGFYLKAERSRSGARSGQNEAKYYMSFRVALVYAPDE